MGADSLRVRSSALNFSHDADILLHATAYALVFIKPKLIFTIDMMISKEAQDYY